MNQSPTIVAILISYLILTPIFVIWIRGFILAKNSWHKHPRLSRMTTTALAIFLLESLVNTYINFWLPYFFSENGLKTSQIAQIYAIKQIITTIIIAVAWGILISAIFGGRQKKSTNYDNFDFEEKKVKSASKSNISRVSGTPVICSKCKQELKKIGNYIDDVIAGGGSVGGAFSPYKDGTISSEKYSDIAAGWDQWLGTICPNCDSIFCPNCLNSNGIDPCPVCQNRVMPASARNMPLKQNFTGNINIPILNQIDNDKVVFVREFKKQVELAPEGKFNTYMVYRADSAQLAQDFLSKHPAQDNIIIETPDGVFGRNKDGIYKE